jgi:hypothetical protein
MTTNRSSHAQYVQPYRYPSPNIPLAAIRRFVRQIAERFQPDKVILFGSYAYGTPHNESDVDLLVIMPAYDVVNQSIRIGNAFDWPFWFARWLAPNPFWFARWLALREGLPQGFAQTKLAIFI